MGSLHAALPDAAPDPGPELQLGSPRPKTLPPEAGLQGVWPGGDTPGARLLLRSIGASSVTETRGSGPRVSACGHRRPGQVGRHWGSVEPDVPHAAFWEEPCLLVARGGVRVPTGCLGARWLLPAAAPLHPDHLKKALGAD